MKKYILLLVAAFGLLTVPILETGCAAPSSRVVQVQTLKAVGHSAEATVALSAQLYADGKITTAQAYEIAVFYDKKFQPAYRLAVAAVNANLDSFASPDLIILTQQLANLLASYQSKP